MKQADEVQAYEQWRQAKIERDWDNVPSRLSPQIHQKVGTVVPFSRMADRDRFWAKVDVSGLDDCWNWSASKSYNGYGRFRLQGKTVKAHRFAYSVTKGTVPENMLVMHRCDNPQCCNPSHLVLGTCADNMIDMRQKGRERWAVGECVGGVKLTTEQVLNIRCDNRFQKDIAMEYGVSQSTISRIKSDVSWRHL